MRTFRALAIVFALTAFVFADRGDAVASVLCKTRGGAVILRQTCKKKETQLDLAQLGGVCPKGDPGPPGSGVRIVDANGRSVGPLVAGGTIMLSVGTQGVVVRVDTAGFVEDGELSYPSNDCTGQGYLSAFNTLTPFGAVVGSTLYYPVLPTQSVHILSFDFQTTPSNCTGSGETVLPNGRCCRASDQGENDMSPAMTLDLGTLGLVPPFRAQVIP